MDGSKVAYPPGEGIVMSSTLNMYVRGATDAELLCDASAVVGMEFRPETEYPTHLDWNSYFAPTVPGPFMLRIEDESETFDFPIGDYRYYFHLDIYGEPGSTPASAAVLALMRKLYDGLVATGRYTCTVIFNDLTLVATNDPNVQASQS